MRNVFSTDRRNFLAAGVGAIGSVLTPEICQAQTPDIGDNPQNSASFPLSFDALYDTSILSTTLKGEAADRLALRRLVDAWANYADRRLAKEQSNLFVPTGTILNYEGEPKTHEPHSTIKGRAAIRTALAGLNTFTVTLHLNGQSDVIHPGSSRNRANLLLGPSIYD